MFINTFIIALFLGVIIWCFAEDNKDNDRRKIIYLEDNNPNFTYTYIISVHSGSKTTSNVVITIEGSDYTTEPHLLKANHSILNSDSEDWFIIKTKHCLGHINNIHIWHNYSGTSPQWFCHKIIVSDVKTNEIAYFDVRRWFSPLEGDGSMSFTFHKQNLFSFGFLFWHYWWSEVYSGTHCWLSIFKKSSFNCYSRKERVGLSMGHLYLILFAGTFRVGGTIYDDVLNGFWVSLVLFPIILILNFLLKFSKPNLKDFIQVYQNGFEFSYKINDLRKNFIPRWSELFEDFQHYQIEGVNLKYPKSPFETELIQKHDKQDKQDHLLQNPINCVKIYDQKFYLHYGFRFFSYICLFFIISNCFYYSLIRVITYEKIQGLHYYICIFVSVTFSIFVLENLKLTLIAFFLSWKNPRRIILENRNDIAKLVNLNIILNNQMNESKKIVNRANNNIYRPLSNTKTDLAIRNSFKKLGLVKLVTDLTIFLIICSCFVAIHNIVAHTFGYYQYHNVDNVITGSPTYGVTTFHDANTPGGILEYIKTVLIPNVYGGVEEGLMIDNVNYRVGVPRLRQLRTKPCPKYSNITQNCLDFDYQKYRSNWNRKHKTTYNLNNMDQFYFLNKFYHKPGKFKYIEKLNDSSWEYQEIDEEPITGNYTTYPKGGYITLLGRDINTTISLYKCIVEENWIDVYTRALFIDFPLYNPNSGYLTTIQIIFEHTSPGEFTRQLTIHPIPARDFEFPYELFLQISFILLLILLLIYLNIEYVKLKVLKPYRYWVNVTDLCSFFLILHTLFAIYCYLRRCQEMFNTINFVANADLSKFYYFKNIFKYQKLLMINLGFMVLYASWKFIQILCVSQAINLFSQSIKSTVSPLINYLFVIFVIISGFGMTSQLIFGSTSEHFQIFTRTFITIVSLTSKNFKFNRILTPDSNSLNLLAMFYYAIAIFIFTWGLRWGFAVILMTYYQKPKKTETCEDRLIANYLHLEMTSMDDLMKQSGRARTIPDETETFNPYLLTEEEKSLSPIKGYGMQQLIIEYYLEGKQDPETKKELVRRSEQREILMTALILESIFTKKLKIHRILECFYERERFRAIICALNVELLLMRMGKERYQFRKTSLECIQYQGVPQKIESNSDLIEKMDFNDLESKSSSDSLVLIDLKDVEELISKDYTNI